jgi:hypothetical protein
MILVRGRLSTDPRTASHASPGGIASANAAIECVESTASLETQLGDEGQDVKRDASTPRLVGRSLAHENNGVESKRVPMIGDASLTLSPLGARRAQPLFLTFNLELRGLATKISILPPLCASARQSQTAQTEATPPGARDPSTESSSAWHPVPASRQRQTR